MPTAETTMAKRTETPGSEGWQRSAQPGSPNKYFMVSADCHANEPKDWVKSRIAPEYLQRLPRLEVVDGQAFIITEGNRPWKLKTDTTDWGPEDIERKWFVIDATDVPLGRLATRVATVLRGKHKPIFTPHMDTGDHVIVINADKVRFSGNKEEAKEYFRHTGYPGGGRTRTPKEVRERKPDFIVRNAVKGMLPKGALGRQMLKKLKVYAGTDHPHEAQNPKALAL